MAQSCTTRLLARGDEALLQALARDDADFDLDDRGAPLDPLPLDAAAEYLADAAVLHWVAERDGVVLGHMCCHWLRLRGGVGRELLLYEIGVRSRARRSGVGRALLAAMRAWMTAHEVSDAWVLADNRGAERFYRACGFEIEEPEPTYLILHLPADE
jgi:GNAT superfamily N-acetyltransferase